MLVRGHSTCGRPNVTTLSRSRGAAIGFVAAVPFAVLPFVVTIQGAYLGFATSIALAAVFAGTVTGATFGRRIAERPRLLTTVLGAALAVVVGAPVGGLAAALLVEHAPDPLTSTVAGLVLYGLPAYLLLALPAFVLGLALAARDKRRRIAGRDF